MSGTLETTHNFSKKQHSIRIHYYSVHFNVETMLIYPAIFQYLLTNAPNIQQDEKYVCCGNRE